MTTHNSRSIDSLHPYYQPIVQEIVRRAPEREIWIFIVQARRSAEYQACLYAQGRLKAGQSGTFGGRTVHTFWAKGGFSVIARCGTAENVVAATQWSRRVTSVLSSYHVEGFAVDFLFRSGRDAKDHYILELEKAKKWNEIDRLFSDLAKLVEEIAPEVIWGGIWKTPDRPHFEWHPGRDLKDIQAGRLPAHPKQCPVCRNFRATMISTRLGDICTDCNARTLPLSVTPKCEGIR